MSGQKMITKAIPATVVILAMAFALVVSQVAIHSSSSLLEWCTDFVLLVWSARPALTVISISAVSLLFIGVIRTIFFILKETFNIHILFSSINVLETSASLNHIARVLHIDSKIVTIKDSEPTAFTAGIIRPKIIISTGLLSLLNTEELTAVLTHERSHLRRRDPLRRFVWECINRLFFFFPIISDCAHGAMRNHEYIADMNTVQLLGTPKHLQASLKKLLLQNLHKPSASSCAFARSVDHVSWLTNPKSEYTAYSFSIGRSMVTLAMVILVLVISLHITSSQAQAISGASCNAVLTNESMFQENMSPAGIIKINYSPLHD